MDILLAIRAIRVRMPHCELKWEIPIEIIVTDMIWDVLSLRIDDLMSVKYFI